VKCKKSVALLALAFTLILVPAVLAKPNKPLIIVMSWDVFWEPYVGWNGPVSGDINGFIEVTLDEARWTPHEKTEHWIEHWVILTEEGGDPIIWGEEEGIASMANGKCNARGRITGATEGWTHLIGCIFHWKGNAEMTDPGPPPQWHLDATMFILPSTGN
jgi:hypothetical protein